MSKQKMYHVSYIPYTHSLKEIFYNICVLILCIRPFHGEDFENLKIWKSIGDTEQTKGGSKPESSHAPAPSPHACDGQGGSRPTLGPWLQSFFLPWVAGIRLRKATLLLPRVCKRKMNWSRAEGNAGLLCLSYYAKCQLWIELSTCGTV